jgi:hypothetical protein
LTARPAPLKRRNLYRDDARRDRAMAAEAGGCHGAKGAESG